MDLIETIAKKLNPQIHKSMLNFRGEPYDWKT